MSSETVVMDLGIGDLGLTPRMGPGRRADPFTAEFLRELVPEDLLAPTAQVQKPSQLVKLRDSHHALARVLATGTGEYEASLITGYSPSRVSILKADPQFQELLEFYRGQATEVVADLRERMANMGLDALSELRERLEDKPEDFSPSLLKEIVRDMADRTGHAPQRGPTTVNNVQVNLGERMARARERAAQVEGTRAPGQGPSPRQIEGSAVAPGRDPSSGTSHE